MQVTVSIKIPALSLERKWGHGNNKGEPSVIFLFAYPVRMRSIGISPSIGGNPHPGLHHITLQKLCIYCSSV